MTCKNHLTRRQLGAIVGALAGAGPVSAQGPIPRRALGKTGFEVGILGIGGAPLGNEDVPQAEVDRIIGTAIDAGVNYIDTAQMYGSLEERIGLSLKGKRDKVFLVAKVEMASSQDAGWQIRQSLRHFQTDYLDAVHIHNVGRTDRFPSVETLISSDGALQAIRDAKKRGLVRHIGLTMHLRPARALPVIETGEIELVMCTANFVEVHTYNFEGTVFAEAAKRGMGIVAMKVLGGTVGNGGNQTGRLSPDHYETAMRYALGIKGLSTAVVGLRRMSDLEAALAAVRSYKPFSASELNAVEAKGRELAKQWGMVRGPVA